MIVLYEREYCTALLSPCGLTYMIVLCLTSLVAVAKQAKSSRMPLQRFESLWIKSLVFNWQNLCRTVWNIVDLGSVRIVSLTFDLSLFGED
jgi:hypothetical protein